MEILKKCFGGDTETIYIDEVKGIKQSLYGLNYNEHYHKECFKVKKEKVFTRICEKCKRPSDKVSSRYFRKNNKRLDVCDNCKNHICEECDRRVDQLYPLITYGAGIGQYIPVRGRSEPCLCRRCSDNSWEYQSGRRKICIDNEEYRNAELTHKLLDEYDKLHLKNHGNEVYDRYKEKWL